MIKKGNTHIELDHFWPYQVVVLADQISRYTVSIVKAEAGLNSSQWRVLAAVADKPGRTAAEVTTVTPMDKTIVSRAVNSLIETGLIKKTPTKTDKRRLSLRTTTSGQKIYTKIATHLNETMVESIKGGTTPESFIKTVKEFSRKMAEISPSID